MEMLDEQEIAQILAKHNSWQHIDDHFEREFKFDSFSAAFEFMTSVAAIAEQQDHHPDWYNSYNRLLITVTSHDVHGLTSRDQRFIAAVDLLCN